MSTPVRLGWGLRICSASNAVLPSGAAASGPGTPCTPPHPWLWLWVAMGQQAVVPAMSCGLSTARGCVGPTWGAATRHPSPPQAHPLSSVSPLSLQRHQGLRSVVEGGAPGLTHVTVCAVAGCRPRAVLQEQHGAGGRPVVWHIVAVPGQTPAPSAPGERHSERCHPGLWTRAREGPPPPPYPTSHVRPTGSGCRTDSGSLGSHQGKSHIPAWLRASWPRASPGALGE